MVEIITLVGNTEDVNFLDDDNGPYMIIMAWTFKANQYCVFHILMDIPVHYSVV